MQSTLYKPTEAAIAQLGIAETSSIQRTRVFYKKYLNEVNDALQSLITAGRLKRMELLSINNRALFNKGKVQRCEWLTKRYSEAQEGFLPDIKNLSLDNRSVDSKGFSSNKKHKTCHEGDSV